jgi:molybdopterin molybdotransferase
MISLSEALATYPREIQPLPTETIAVSDALHRVLREPALARCDLPRFSQSALDGYVLTNDDAARAPGTLTITGSIAAGDGHALRPLVNGECQRILTGARVPPNAGAVVAQERVNVIDGKMTLSEPLKPGANIRWQAEELREGATLGVAGQRLTPGHIAALAMAGVEQVTVTRKPRILVLVSGDEVKPLGTALAAGQIWDSNGPLVVAWLQARGYAAMARHLPDTREEVERSLQSALNEADLVITTGGVSVGDKDYILPVAEQLGVRRVFWQVAQKPGKPLYFGLRDRTVLMGLPGNPGAVLIGLTLHVRAVLDRLEQSQHVGAIWHSGLLATPAKADSKRDCLLRMRMQIETDGVVRLQPLPHQDSHMMSNLSSADVLVWAPARETSYAASEILRWTYL